MPNRKRRRSDATTDFMVVVVAVVVRRRQCQLTDRPGHWRRLRRRITVWPTACLSNGDGEARREPPFATFMALAASKRKGRGGGGRPTRCPALRPYNCLRPLPSVLGPTSPTAAGLWPLFLRPSSRVDIDARCAWSGTVQDYREFVMCCTSALQETPRFESLGDFHLESTTSLQLKFQLIF